ncbi:MAG: hypothetical protein KC549_16175 [Myxococcales bacterium]|nr:hypothetical protein [Myxococcales bacterium]MCB9546131.1 hypothetical protein [Myxococcales bacterium]
MLPFDDLLALALSRDGFTAREAIDKAPLADVQRLLEELPKHGPQPTMTHAARQRLWALQPDFRPFDPPADKAAFLVELAASLEARLAAGLPARYSPGEKLGFDRLPALIEVVRGFDPSPRSVVEEGALYLVEARMRLPGEAVFRPRNQQLCLLSGAFTYSLPHAMGDVQVYLQRGPAREAAGQGVGTVWERELPSVRAQHIRMGLRGDDRTIGPEEIGAWQEEILSCQ